MAVEIVSEIPDIPDRLNLKYREIVNIIQDSENGKVYKFTTTDDKKISAGGVRMLLESRTGKTVRVKRFDANTVYIKVLSSPDIKTELAERKKRAEEMKKKLAGKTKEEKGE